MYRNPVRQGHNPENTIAESRDLPSEANPGIPLNFDPNRIFNNFNAPLAPDVRALTQYFILKVSGVLVLRHDSIICQSRVITKAQRPASPTAPRL